MAALAARAVGVLERDDESRTMAALAERTVGVLERDDEKMQQGYTLMCQNREVFLLDEDGRIVHEWRSDHLVFCAYLLPGGNLLRDGSESADAPCFQAGGAAGFVEVVDWHGEQLWSFTAVPFDAFLTHHDLEPLPNGNVLVMCWERKRCCVRQEGGGGTRAVQ